MRDAEEGIFRVYEPSPNVGWGYANETLCHSENMWLNDQLVRKSSGSEMGNCLKGVELRHTKWARIRARQGIDYYYVRFRRKGALRKMMDDDFSLASFPAQAGFSSVARVSAVVGSAPDFQRYARDVRDGGRRMPDPLFLEARKP